MDTICHTFQCTNFSTSAYYERWKSDLLISETENVGDRFEENRSRSVDLMRRPQADGNGMGDALSFVTGTNENTIAGSSSLNTSTANNDSSNSKYHVFFSHVREDRDWVIEVLNKLESPEYGFKCCFADRDFELGRSVFENITRSIQASAKTVIVLSFFFDHLLQNASYTMSCVTFKTSNDRRVKRVRLNERLQSAQKDRISLTAGLNCIVQVLKFTYHKLK